MKGTETTFSDIIVTDMDNATSTYTTIYQDMRIRAGERLLSSEESDIDAMRKSMKEQYTGYLFLKDLTTNRNNERIINRYWGSKTVPTDTTRFDGSKAFYFPADINFDCKKQTQMTPSLLSVS